MDEMKLILQFLTDYGVSMIIVGLFLYVIIRIANIFIKQLEDKYNTDRARKDHDAALDKRSNVGTEIQSLIQRSLEKTHGHRLQVIEFSNSVMSVAYLPFRYMTCTYEVHGISTAAAGYKIDRVSTSLFHQFFSILQSVKHFTFNINDPSCEAGGAMCELMKNQNEDQALCVAMVSSKGKFIGFIALMKEENFTDADIDLMDSLADRIGVLLSVADK